MTEIVVPDTGITASAWIADRIAKRYGHPSRRNYLYLFQLRSGVGFVPIPPDPLQIVSSWFDEGDGLAASPVVEAVERCRRLNSALRATADLPRGKFSTRQMMSRIVVFSVTLITAEIDPMMSVDLFSRALAFTPKADRRVVELWKPGGEGWYSTYTGDDK